MKQFLRLLRHPLAIALVVVICLTGGVLAARYVAWPVYKDWREERWLTMAGKFREQNELRNAGLVLRKVIDANPVSLDAWELILSIAREEDGPGLLPIYNQIALLKPNDEELHLEWATAAIRRGNFAAAKTALDKLEGNDSPTYHRLAAAVGLGSEELEIAEVHFRRLLELEPDDKQVALNLAIVHLQLDNEVQAQKGRQNLLALAAEGGDIRTPAIRALLTDALAKDRLTDAKRYTNELRLQDNLLFRDRLLILQALDRTDTDQYGVYLNEVMVQAGENITRIRSLARFLNNFAQREPLRRWIESLPEELRDDQEVNLQYIETLVFMEDLPALEARLRNLPWERDDFYRNAILAHTLRGQGREREAGEMWQRAVIAAQESIRDQRILYLQAKSWNWDAERLDLLSRIYQRNPREKWAFVELFAHFQTTRNTPELTRLFSRQVEVDVADIYARNNLAYLWLLQRSNLSRAYTLAQETYNKDPENAQFRTTYAFSLYRQGRNDESLRVFNEMDEEEKNASARALHYSLILAANNKWDQVKATTERLPPANLFPEEDRLLDELRTQLAEHL